MVKQFMVLFLWYSLVSFLSKIEAQSDLGAPLQAKEVLNLLRQRRNNQGNCPADKCLDQPPVFNPLPCFVHVVLGECDSEELRGYCECTCGNCNPDKPVQNRYCPNRCSDARPPNNSSYTCLQHRAQGSCKAEWMQGYCQCTCGTCPLEFTEDESISSIKSTARSVGNFGVDIKSATADAIARVKQGDLDPLAAAETVSISIAQAVAKAVASTSISAQVQNGQAVGNATASAQSIAIATANATASAFAEAGDSQIYVETATLATDIKVAIVNSSASLVLSGSGFASIQNNTMETVVAKVIAEATAKAFASIANNSPTAIAAGFVNIIPNAECSLMCEDVQPRSISCVEEKLNGNCNAEYMKGCCQCTCNKCNDRFNLINSHNVGLKSATKKAITNYTSDLNDLLIFNNAKFDPNITIFYSLNISVNFS